MENPASLLRRLNPCCARAMEGAASLCHTRAHAEILPEHWLLKLLEQGEGDLTVLARRYEWDMDALWQDLLSWLDKQPRSVRHRPQLSDHILRLMQEAWLIASLSGETQIRSVHLLMALVEKPNLIQCDGLWPLLTLGQRQLERLRSLLDAQSDERPPAQQEAALAQPHGGDVEFVGRPAGSELNADGLNPALQNALEKFTLDVTAKARDGQIDPVFGRDTEIRQMVDILSRRRKNNPILVGEPGVGKTALVEGLALRIAEGNVPDALKPVSVRTLDLGLLQAGAGVKGEFEQRLKNIIEAVQQSPSPVLLFIDEAHTIIGAGNQAGGADAANLLKPALARGELRTIAATTWSEYKQYFERDAALERRFQMVKVDEPDDDTACLMLRGLKSRYADHHGVHITDDAVRAAVTLSRRYLTGRQLPDKAVDLLDTASARLRMSLDTVPEPLTRMKAQLTALAMEKQALLEDIALGNSARGDRLAAIEQEEIRLILALDTLETQYGQELQLTEALLACRRDISRQAEISDLQTALIAVQQGNPLLGLDVDVRTVATVIADWTGVPLPGTTQHIASPASRFLALTGVLRQPGKTQQGIQALVTLLAPETTVRVSPYSLRPVAISQPLGFYGDDDFLLDGNMPLGDEAMDASSQLLVALTTDNPAEAQGWKPDGPLFRDFLILLRVYLGWRFRADITLTAPTRLLAVPPLGDEPFWLGMNGVLGVGEGESEDDIPQTFTTELGTYTGLQPATFLQGNRRVTYKFD